MFYKRVNGLSKIREAKSRLIIPVYIGLLVSTLLVFWQVRNFDFVGYDDGEYVSENQHILDGLTSDGLIWAFTTGHAANWHPVTWLSLMLDCQLFGKDPGRIHLVNVILHLANTLLLFAVLKKMTRSLWPSAFVAAAFAIHPMHVESVAWIAERKDVLGTLFWLLTMAAYAGYVKRPSAFRYAAALLLFALGLMAKPMLVTLPFVLLLLDYWPLNRLETPQSVTMSAPISQRSTAWYRLVIEKIPFFILAAVSSVITFVVQQTGQAVSEIDVLPLKGRIFNAAIAYFQYINKMFWPSKLAVLYPHPLTAIPAAKAAVCILLLIALTGLFLYFAGKRKYLAAGWLWYLGTLVPVIGLVQVGSQAYADRYTYIPYIGLFIMIAWGVSELLSKMPQRKFVLGLLAAIVLTPLGLCTYRQLGHWNNTLTLFSHAVEVTSNNAIAHNNLSAAHANLGNFHKAVENAQRAITIKPDNPDAHNNLGFAYGGLGRYPEAVEALNRAIRIKPDFADPYNNLGAAYNSLGRHQEAIEALNRAITIKPDYADPYNNLGVAYESLSRHQEAIEALNQAITIKPQYADPYSNLGAAYIALGRHREAIDVLNRAIAIKPNYADPYNNLGVAYVCLGRLEDAIKAYQQAIRINPDYALAHKNLQAARLALKRSRQLTDREN